jgi:hypothetical protein
LLIELAFAAAISTQPARAEPVSAAPAPSAREIDLSGAWKRRDDPRDVGIIGKWHNPRTDDARWADASGPGGEEPAIPAKKGARGRDKKDSGRYWLRRTVVLPGGGPSRLFLSLSHPGDSVDVFINGTPVVRDLKSGLPVVREITRFTGAGGDFLLALRVKMSRTSAGYGPGSVRIIMSGESRPLFSGLPEWISFLAREEPLLAWPAWATGRALMRAPVGLPGSPTPALVGGEGQLVPPDRSCVVSCWVYEESTKRFFAPEAQRCAFSLDERVLPIPEVSVPMGRFNMYLRFWADSMEDEPGLTLAVGEVTVANASDRTRSVELFVAVHPLLPWVESGGRGGVLDMASVEHDPASRTILVDGKPAVILTTPADYFIAAPFEEGIVARSAAAGLPAAARAEDPGLRLASGAAVYRLKIQPFGARTMTFRVFLSGAPGKVTPEFTQAIRDINRKWSQKENLNEWRRLLVGKDRFFLRIPDKRAQDTFYASIGHLLAGLGAGRRPDAGLLAAALETTGHDEFARTLKTGQAQSATSATPPGEPEVSGRFRPASFIREIAAVSATEPALAQPLMDKALKRMAAPGAFAWAEIEDEATGRWTGGEMPGLSAAAEFILAVRGMLVRDGGDYVEIAPAVPPAWLKPGNQVEIKNAPTRHGLLGFAVTARESGFVLNINQAPAAPGGCRWCVPGKRRIGKLVIDGKAADIPADRCVVIPEGVRRVAVIW